MKKLRIMWLHSHLSYWGGGTKYIFEVMKELSKKHEISLFVQKSSNKISEKFSEIPINVTTLDNLSTGDISFWFNFDKIIKKETRELKENKGKFDIIVSSMFPMNVIANKIGLPHIQYCFEPFAFFWDSNMIDNLPIFKKIPLKYFKGKYVNEDLKATEKSTRILTVNNETVDWIKKIYSRESIPTLLGVDTEKYQKKNNEELQKKYKNKIIIIHSTDWTPLKRTNWLIDQFIKIASSEKNMVLLITEVITSGKERDIAFKKIQSMKAKNIELCGFIDNDLLSSYYSMADFAIYSGIGEGASAASLFVLECLACETPVIRTNYTDEEVIHGKTGYLFSQDNEKEFQKYVINLCKNKQLCNEMGKNGREFIKKRYSWSNVSKIFDQNFKELLN
jgi:glycosyltransferase involved in cell wall biosynthesis